MKNIVLFFLGLVVVAVGVIVFKLHSIQRSGPMIYGVSFNSEYANYLGLDTKDVFTKILDEWNFRYIRLSAQWDLIEKNKGQYDFEDLDWQMNAAAARNAKVMLAVGYKTPRWPECHTPAWAAALPAEETKASLYNFIQLVVERYKNHTALEIWQVENEPFLKFGDCGIISEEQLHQEIDLVKQLDANHPAIVTASGELSLWRDTAKATDLFGTTLYRVVWNKMTGYFSYDWIIPAIFYKAKLWFNGRDINSAYITELQTEPWIPDKSLLDTPIEEQYKSMGLERLKKNIIFAEKTGMPRTYLWGGEWWYWLEKKGETAIPNFIKDLNKGL